MGSIWKDKDGRYKDVWGFPVEVAREERSWPFNEVVSVERGGQKYECGPCWDPTRFDLVSSQPTSPSTSPGYYGGDSNSSSSTDSDAGGCIGIGQLICILLFFIFLPEEIFASIGWLNLFVNFLKMLAEVLVLVFIAGLPIYLIVRLAQLCRTTTTKVDP